MNEKQLWREKAKFFIYGMLTFLGIILLTGASENSVPTLNFGRYQLSAWATNLGQDSGAIGAFVMDTVSGETKTVYES